jgi:hypothetical protein
LYEEKNGFGSPMMGEPIYINIIYTYYILTNWHVEFNWKKVALPLWPFDSWTCEIALLCNPLGRTALVYEPTTEVITMNVSRKVLETDIVSSKVAEGNP